MSASTGFPIVGIGASAGGIPALQTFFKALPEKPGLAIVIVTHLNPDRKSLLHEVLGHYTAIPIEVAEEGTVVERNRVYVMPSDMILTIEGRTLHAQKPDSTKRERKPIDIFLASLAEDQGEYAVGIILSGADADGTLGAKALREAGGLTMAQTSDGSSPSNPSMPQTAISTGMIDLAIPVEEMADRLIVFAQSLGALDDVARDSETFENDELDNAHSAICAILSTHSTHDFSGYKRKTFFRRVLRRMQVRQLQSLTAYIELLRTEPPEVTNLFRDLLINVTNFFRDEDAFAVLQQTVVPKLFEGKNTGDTVRVWVPGCATGEEVYSLAILLREQLDKVTVKPKIQIFATDIDDPVLGVARTGRYPEALLGGLSPERRQRFFTTDGASYAVTNEIRELCIFSPHNLIQDPPFSRMDLVSCRNLLIYFGPEIQRQVIPIFHYSLRPGGYLFLGSSESIGQHSDLFTTIDKKQRIFQARDHSPRMLRLPSMPGAGRSFIFLEGGHGMQRDSSQSLRSKVEARILERYAPAHVVVNAEGDIVYYSAGTGRFLEPPQGVPSRQLLTLARKGLRLDLRAALRECVTLQKPISRHNIPIDRDDNDVQIVGFTIEPTNERDGSEALYLVVFQAKGPAGKGETDVQSPRLYEGAGELDRELRDTKERLQSTIEEYETALEELKSSNEELVSVNEEAQSSNEELEASKEEAQSLNEELNTINAELTNKIEELDRANSDLRNLFESTQIATIFLDRALVIRTFTPAAASFFNLRPTDVGRPLTELSTRLEYSSFRDDIRAVFATGDTLNHRLARDSDGKHHLVRLIPYRLGGEAIDGVVVTFIDVTQLAEAERHQQVLVSELNHRVKNILLVIASIAKRTLESAPSLDVFRPAFLGRMEAMGRAYGALSRQDWKDTSLRDLISEELKPFGEASFALEGPPLRLDAEYGLPITMVIHELVTNASKYGALSVSGGSINLSWQLNENVLQMRWQERNGPPVQAPQAPGFGMELLRGEVEYRLQGKIETNFNPNGLIVELEIPISDRAVK